MHEPYNIKVLWFEINKTYGAIDTVLVLDGLQFFSGLVHGRYRGKSILQVNQDLLE